MIRQLMPVFLLLWLLSESGTQCCAQYRQGSDATQNPGSANTVRYDSLPAEVPGTGEKLLWLGGATMTYALFDYVGYNLVRGNDGATAFYRVIQSLVQAGITWLLYEKLGLPTAAAFNLLWWTWGVDALFYGYTEAFNVGGSWLGRGIFQSHIMDNNCSWASWTPVGMARGMDSSKPIAGDTLVAQFLIGAASAITISITF